MVKSENALKIPFLTTKKERGAYGLFFVGQNIFYMLIINFLQVFMTDKGITAAAVAAIFLVAKVWDAVNDPLFGVIIDRTKPKKGKFLPWVRASVIPITLTTILIFVMPDSISMGAKIAWSAIAYMLWDVSYTLCDAPIFALTTAMTDNIQERTTLISIGRLAAMIAALVVSLAVPLLYPNIGWQAMAIAFSILGFATMFPITRIAKERILSKKESAPSLGDIWNYLKGNKYLLIFYASMVIYYLTNTMQVVGPYFATNNLGNPETYTLLMAVTVFPMLIIAVIVPALAKRYGKFKLYILSIIWYVVFSVITYFVGYANQTILMGILLLRGIGLGFTSVLMFMFAPDCVEYGTFKTGDRAEGVTFSMQTFATKLMNGLSSALGMAVLALFSFKAGAGVTQSPQTLNGIWLMFSLFPAIGAVASLPFLAKFKLRDSHVQVMAQANNGEITREEALLKLPEEFRAEFTKQI